MLLKELLLTDIVEVSETELKYKIMDLNTYDSFCIFDKMDDKPNYQFIVNIFLDNGIMPMKKDVKTFQRLIKKNPLYFNAVYLKVDDNGIIMTPMTVEDIVIIPNVQARGFARYKNELLNIRLSMENLKGGH